YVPMLFGIAWVVHFWRARRSCWNWSRHLPIVLLVALVTTAYGWLFDQIVLLPAFMQVAVPLERRRLRLQAIAAYLAASALMILFVVLRKTGTSYTWTAPAWLVLYIWLRRAIEAQSGSPPTEPLQASRAVGIGRGASGDHQSPARFS
ncbi:MAG TPA: hypothetical protein VKB60_01910, partial [Terriglobales bacterium]|nr:hypothetical protein [Terriglobales bacterium]